MTTAVALLTGLSAVVARSPNAVLKLRDSVLIDVQTDRLIEQLDLPRGWTQHYAPVTGSWFVFDTSVEATTCL